MVRRVGQVAPTHIFSRGNVDVFDGGRRRSHAETAALRSALTHGGNLLRRYVQGAGANEELVWYEGSGTSDRRYLVQDELGTVIAADGPSGVMTYSYDEYGNPNVWNSPSAAPRFRYAGAIMLPEARLYAMGARVYASATGRFLQTDPILFNGGMNLYAYTGNDPVNAIDPSGLDSITWPVPIGCGDQPCPRSPRSQPGHSEWDSFSRSPPEVVVTPGG